MLRRKYVRRNQIRSKRVLQQRNLDSIRFLVTFQGIRFLIIYKERMAPGSSSMLRSRRRDVNVKPNRVLDRNSSRGMIYENEELRLRTININAEVERGQNDIKKLRRENDQLRREIWSLREEYDRLEDLLKSKERAAEEGEESEDEESDGKDEADQENATNQQKVAKDSDMLSVVEEEPEENSTEGEERQHQQQTPQQTQQPMSPLLSFYGEDGLPPPLIPPPFLHSTNLGQTPLNTGGGIPVVQNNIPGYQPTIPGFQMPGTPFPHSSMPRIFPQDLDQFIRSCCPGPPVPSVVGVPPTVIRTEGEIHEQPEALPSAAPPQTSQPIATQEPSMTSLVTTNPVASGQSNVNNIAISNDLRCEPYAGQVPAYLRLNCVQPHTLYFPVTSSNFNDLTVQEVIDSMSEQLSPKLLGSLKGVRLVGGACYLSLGSDEDVQSIIRLPLKMRGLPLQTEDASAGAMFIALSGVPHDVSDESVANTLAHFGTIIGGVERRLYRGVDTGERLTRLRPKLAIPRAIWIAGCRVCLRIMRPDEVSTLALARRKSFRSHLHVRLRPLQEDGTPQPAPTPPIPPLPATTTTSSVTQSVPNLAPQILDSLHPIGFSCTQSVPDLTIRPPPPDPPPKPKPQFFSSSSANNVFLFPPPCPDPKRHTTGVQPTHLPGMTPIPPQTPMLQSGRSQSTPPAIPIQSPAIIQRQTSQSDPETPKPPSPSPSKLQRHRSSRKASKPNSPVETRKQNGDASSSSGQDSPTKPSRRRVSVYFKRNGSLRRATSMEQTDGTAGELTTTCSERERSNSDVSSRASGGGCRRKMSSTGRENGKVPWCGCWGNGCL